MRTHVTDLQSGDKLTGNIFNSYGLHVLSGGTVLNDECISKLFRHNIDYVDVDRPKPEAAVPPSSSSRISASFHLAYEASLEGINDLFEQALSEGKIDPRIVDSSFEPLADSYRKENDLVLLMLSLESNDNYTYQHSVQVGMLSYYIAKWLGYSEDLCVITGKAGFVHDIGKCRIDPRILHKPAKLTAEEYEEIKKHTLFSQEILEMSFESGSPLVLGPLQHHERMDGRGYPNKLRSDQIHPVAKILAVADIYSAMICTRVYQKERDMLNVLRELYRLSFGEIDAVITQVFLRQMIPSFIGKTVLLDSGEMGVILMTNPSDYFRPLVQVDQHYIDLTQRPDLMVCKILL